MLPVALCPRGQRRRFYCGVCPLLVFRCRQYVNLPLLAVGLVVKLVTAMQLKGRCCDPE